MKSYLHLTTILAGTLIQVACVSIDLPGIVTDTAKVSKEAYQSWTGDKSANNAPARLMVSHSYVGSQDQSVAEVRRQCVDEAQAKWAQLAGPDASYSVAENVISVGPQAVVANCKLVELPASTPASTTSPKKK